MPTGGDDQPSGGGGRVTPGPPRWLVRLNAGLLRLGLPIGTQRVLNVPGRASGRLRSTPVSLVTVAGRRYVVATSAAAD